MASLDHVVINTLRGMDAAAACFSALGFTLTPRGHHTLGSINHLMVVPGAYLELVGVPDEGLQRREVLESPPGLNGLVLRTDDADATHRRLQASGFDVAPAQAFSRPAVIDGETVDVAFRTVRMAPGQFAAGRVYFCEHLTPQYVWRDEWQRHPNGFLALEAMDVDSPRPQDEAALHARAFGLDARAALPVADAAGRRVLTLAGPPPFRLAIRPGAHPRYASLSLRFASLERLDALARRRSDVLWKRQDALNASLTLPQLGLRLDCIGTAP